MIGAPGAHWLLDDPTVWGAQPPTTLWRALVSAGDMTMTPRSSSVGQFHVRASSSTPSGARGASTARRQRRP